MIHGIAPAGPRPVRYRPDQPARRGSSGPRDKGCISSWKTRNELKNTSRKRRGALRTPCMEHRTYIFVFCKGSWPGRAEHPPAGAPRTPMVVEDLAQSRSDLRELYCQGLHSVRQKIYFVVSIKRHTWYISTSFQRSNIFPPNLASLLWSLRAALPIGLEEYCICTSGSLLVFVL